MTVKEPTVDWSALPEGWAARHPKIAYPGETLGEHVNRLRALAEGVPAKRERWLEYARKLERRAKGSIIKSDSA